MPSEADYAIQRSAVITQADCNTSPVGLQTITHVQLDCSCSDHGLPCACNKSAVNLGVDML